MKSRGVALPRGVDAEPEIGLLFVASEQRIVPHVQQSAAFRRRSRLRRRNEWLTEGYLRVACSQSSSSIPLRCAVYALASAEESAVAVARYAGARNDGLEAHPHELPI